MMETEKTCLYCQKPFVPAHGNKEYCCDSHYDEARRERQKQRRDPVARLIAILMENHEKIYAAYLSGKTELNQEEISARQIDLSLARQVKPPAGHEGLMYDFGEFSLLTDRNFQTFKIIKNDTSTINPE